MKTVDDFISVCESNIINITTISKKEILDDEDIFVLEAYGLANEAKLSTADRNALPNSAFGLPAERKYPLFLKTKEESMSHIKNAIQFFHFCPEKDRKQLAKNIEKAAKEHDIEITENSLVRKYL